MLDRASLRHSQPVLNDDAANVVELIRGFR